MKVIVWTRYGPPEVLQLQELEKPTPKPNEVLVKVRATNVTAGDTELRDMKMPGWLRLPMRIYVGPIRPTRIRVLGQELAGCIEAVGADVKQFKVGDQVYATTGFGFGAYAEYRCLPETPEGMSGVLAIMPANMSYVEAAAIPIAGLEALYFYRKANIRSGEKVLVYGAGGSIGTLTVQLAKQAGAEVTGLDSTGKLEMLRSIGADHVIDYTREEFTKNGERYDVIIDVIGKSPFSGSVQSLKPNGRYLLANAGPLQSLRGRLASGAGGKQVIVGTADHKAEDLVALRDLIEAGKLKAIIDRTYPLEQMAEAHKYVATGQKMGNVVITVGET